MGERLELNSNDSLFDKTRTVVKGISGGCLCCGIPIHVSFDNLDILPMAKINLELFQVLVCDQCENDVAYLEKAGFGKVSFDILGLIQEDLRAKLDRHLSYYGNYTEDDRLAILHDLYSKALDQLKENKVNKK